MSTNRHVLDSYAVMSFLQKEPGWERVRDLLAAAARGTAELHISLINLAEVQYTVIRRHGDHPTVLAAIESLSISRASADEYIPQVVALKARNSVALADCFAAALAIDLNCPVLTGDPDFRKLETVVDVEWL